MGPAPRGSSRRGTATRWRSRAGVKNPPPGSRHLPATPTMNPPPAPTLLIALLAACGNSGSSDVLLVGGDDDAQSFTPGDAGGLAALDAYIERDQVAVKFVTLNCSGDCATVEAVGT